jgi:hypothetical protein
MLLLLTLLVIHGRIAGQGALGQTSGAGIQNEFTWATQYGKSPTQFTVDEWREIIDSAWGAGLPTPDKVALFDFWWNEVDLRYGAFFNLEVDVFEFRDRFRPEVKAGVSRGRFAAIMNYSGYWLQDLHTYVFDVPVRNTTLRKGIPLFVIGQWGTNRHFGAVVTPLPDSTLVVYRVLANHPLGLEPGDLVLGYDGELWKDIYPRLVEAELPLFLNSVNGSTDEANAYYHLQAVGLNWHLFDTIDVVKYGTGDTLHFPTGRLAGQSRTIWGSEQIDVPGVTWPDRSQNDRVSWGVVEGTKVGYVYVTSWSFDAQFGIRQQFREAIDNLMHDTVTAGIILDFRFNTGGGALAVDGLSLLFREVTPTIGFDQRTGSPDHFAMEPDPGRLESALVIRPNSSTFYDKPIAVLIGPGSISAGELEALRLSFHPRARLVGRTAAGGNTGSDFLDLGNSDWFASLATGSMYLVSDHRYLSHIGLEPDEPIWFTRDDVVNGIDTVVEAALDWIESESATGITDDDSGLPSSIRLQTFPNPFQQATTIFFNLRERSNVRVSIYNVRGQRVATLLDRTLNAGDNEVQWLARGGSGRRVSPGTYFCRIQAGATSETRAMVFLPGN